MNDILLSFDFGTKSIGVAVGQRITFTASPLEAIKVKNSILQWRRIGKILEEWKPEKIIVGLPLKMDGTEQPISKNAREFANKIYHFYHIEVKLQDERLTTIEARDRLFQYGGFHALSKKAIDSISAVIILENYLSTK